MVYEVTWARQLSLIFGTDIFAITAILSVFFSGLAIGSFVFGKIADVSQKYLLIWAVLEFGIGIWALLSPAIFTGIKFLQIAVWQNFSPGFGTFNFWTFAFSFLALLFPTIFIGGTFPVVSRLIIKSKQQVAPSIGLLYFANTFGAALGALTAGFFLIAAFGVQESVYIAAALNLIIGALLLLMSRKLKINSAAKDSFKQIDSSQKTPAPVSTHTKIVQISFFTAAAITGFAALALEVLLTRLIIMVFGASTYAFSIVLVAFLLGIAFGSLIISQVARFPKLSLVHLFAFFQILIGILVIFSIPALGNLPLDYLEAFKTGPKSFTSLQISQISLSLKIMILPTLLMGASFPLLIRLAAENFAKFGSSLGQIYGTNTIGSVLGSFLASFLIIPALGLQKGILSIGIVYLFLGLVFFLIFGAKLAKTAALIIFIVAIASAINQKNWNKSILTAGFYAEPSSFVQSDQPKHKWTNQLQKNLNKNVLLFEKDGLTGNIAVRRDKDGTLNLRIDGKADASTGADMEQQILLGHLPFLFYPEAKDSLVIGLGSAITLGSVLSHPVNLVDAVEIEKEVIVASKFFNDYNNNALTDPRVNLVNADGRNFLLLGNKQYDIITAEPSNLWLSGSSKLFTLEYFQLLKKGLKENGIALQWIHLYAIDLEGLKTVFSAYQSVFPNVLVMGTPVSHDLMLIGSKRPLQIKTPNISAYFEDQKVKDNLSYAKITSPFQIASYFLLNTQSLENFVSNTKPNTDNHPYVEFQAPKNLYLPTTSANWRALLENLSPISSFIDNSDPQKTAQIINTAEEFRLARILTELYFVERKTSLGIEHGEKALNLAPDNDYLKILLAKLYFERGTAEQNRQEYSLSIKSYKRSLELEKTPAVYFNLGQSYKAHEMAKEAREAYRHAISLDPSFAPAYLYLSEIEAQQNNLDGSIEILNALVIIDPENAEALANLGQLYFLKNDLAKAKEYLNKSLKINPDLNEAKSLLDKIPN